MCRGAAGAVTARRRRRTGSSLPWSGPRAGWVVRAVTKIRLVRAGKTPKRPLESAGVRSVCAAPRKTFACGAVSASGPSNLKHLLMARIRRIPEEPCPHSDGDNADTPRRHSPAAGTAGSRKSGHAGTNPMGGPASGAVAGTAAALSPPAARPAARRQRANPAHSPATAPAGRP